jgi:hypothetical protein
VLRADFWGRCSPGSINHGGGGRGEVPYLATYIHRPRNSPYSRPCAPPLRICSCSTRFCHHPHFPLSFSMSPPQIRVLEPHPWPRSIVTPLALNELVKGGLLAPAGDGLYLAWMVPPTSDKEPNPPYAYVPSFIRLRERGFTAPASRFIRGCATIMGWSFTTSPQRHIPGGFLRRCPRGVPREPGELGSLGPPFLR